MSRYLPIKVLAPLLFGIPVLAIGVWLSLAWNRQARTAVNRLADQNIEQIHRSAATKIADMLSIPVRVCEVNQHLISAGLLVPTDLDGWRPTLVHQSRTFDVLSAISWGSADGKATWVSRYADGSYYWALKDDPASATMTQWKLGRDGHIVSDSMSTFEFDLSTRPWYQTPRDARRAIWSEPYVWVGGDAGDQKMLGISYGIPIFNGGQELMGVIDADFSLNDLSRYLGQLKIGETGMAVLVTRDGRLLAASNDTPVVAAGEQQVLTLESSNPLVVAAGSFLKNEQASHESRAVARIDDETYYLRASRVGEEFGLHWTLATIVPEKDFLGEINAEFSRSGLISFIAVIMAVGLGLVAARWLVNPLTQLVEAVRKIGQGDLDTRLEIEHAPEYSKLASEINQMTIGLKDRMRMQKSLSLAMEVQRNLLPAASPKFHGLDIAGHSTYCDETGGDYYDFLDVSGTDEDTAVLAIGDVMGHGVAAALLMATARGILRSRCAVPGSLADFLNHLNDMLVVDTQGERFMTMLLITLSARKDALRWASAGHGPPILYDRQSDSFQELDGGGLPLGLVEGESYSEYRQPGIKSGTLILAATDGLEETMNEAGDQYGKSRLLELLRENADKTAQEISQIIHETLAAYRGGNSQDDDLTFVVVKVL